MVVGYIMSWFIHLLLCLFSVGRMSGVELTFELPDSAKECFHQEIEKGTESTLEFQVLCFSSFQFPELYVIKVNFYRL